MRRLFLPLLLLPLAAQAEADYVMVYRGENEWVAQEDTQPLRRLLKEARAQKTTAFTFSRSPDDNDSRGMNRVLILRDILSRQIKPALTLTEIPSDGVAPNTIVVRVP